MRNVTERLNSRLDNLNLRITEKRIAATQAQQLTDSVHRTLVKLERIRANIERIKLLWVEANNDDPSPE